MSVKKLNDVQLVKKYEKLVDERLKINREIKQVADVMKDRIVRSEDNHMLTPTKRVYIQYITCDRMKPIKELEDEFGESGWMNTDEDSRKLSSPRNLKLNLVTEVLRWRTIDYMLMDQRLVM